MNTKSKVAVAIALSLAACLCLFSLLYLWMGGGVVDVDQEYVKEHVGKPGYVLVDVREARIFHGASPVIAGVPGGHIPGAVNFPSSELRFTRAAEALKKAGITKNATLIVYCNKGVLSGKFIETLIKDFGYNPKKIKHYKDSMIDWAADPENPILPEDHDPK